MKSIMVARKVRFFSIKSWDTVLDNKTHKETQVRRLKVDYFIDAYSMIVALNFTLNFITIYLCFLYSFVVFIETG